MKMSGFFIAFSTHHSGNIPHFDKPLFYRTFNAHDEVPTHNPGSRHN